MILRMIATGSLSAFSASVLQGTGALPPTQAAGAVRLPSGLQQVRATQAQPVGQPPQVPQPGPGNPSTAPAGRVPPRGSLLDLSV
jgi:hypothetical protein